MRDDSRQAANRPKRVPNVGTMLSTAQEIPTKTLQHSAENIGQVTELRPDLPCIVPTDTPVGSISQLACWSRTIVSIGISLLGHAGILAWLGYAPGALLSRMIPVQNGHASIELTASVASTSQQVSYDDPTDVVQFDTPVPSSMRPNEQPVPTMSAVSMPIQRSEQSDLMPTFMAAVPDVEVPSPRELTVHRNELVREQLPSEEITSTSDDHLPVARTRVDRQPTVEVLAETAERHASSASLPSPASQASEGVDSLPAVVHNPAPLYPSDALRARRMGRVVLHVGIAADGSVTEATVYRSSGVRSLDRAALEAVRKWRFESSESASVPVRYAAVPIRFEIVESNPR